MARSDSRSDTDLPVILLGTLGTIKYKTRLEKLAFLCDMEIFTDWKWYNDWIPYKYGPFSRKLLDDMDRLSDAGLVNIRTIKDPFGQATKEYSLTDSGRQRYVELFATYAKQGRHIRESLVKYNTSISMLPLLRKVYNKYPQYAARSLISENVGRG